MRIVFLVDTLTSQGNDINLERTHLEKDEIEYLTANQRQLRKTEKADKEDDCMKEQALLPSHHRVNKQGRLMGQSDTGANHNTINISDYELIPTPKGCQSEENWWVGQEQYPSIHSLHDLWKTEYCTP